MKKKKVGNRSGKRAVELYGDIATPKYLQNHVQCCRICSDYDPELKRIVDRMISEEEGYETIQETCDQWGELLPRSTLEAHKAYYHYLCDEQIFNDLLTELDKCGDMKRKYLTFNEQKLIKQYGQVQELKQMELLDLWKHTIPNLRKCMFVKVYEDGEIVLKTNPMIEDIVRAYDILLKDALLLEGKPTGRLAVEQTTKGHDGKVVTGIERLLEMLGVDEIVETSESQDIVETTKSD